MVVLLRKQMGRVDAVDSVWGVAPTDFLGYRHTYVLFDGPPSDISPELQRYLDLPFWGQRAPAFRPGGEWPSPLPLLEHPCSTAGRRTGADPVWGGLRASAFGRLVPSDGARRSAGQAASGHNRRGPLHSHVCLPSIRTPARSGGHPARRSAFCRSPQKPLPFPMRTVTPYPQRR